MKKKINKKKLRKKTDTFCVWSPDPISEPLNKIKTYSAVDIKPRGSDFKSSNLQLDRIHHSNETLHFRPHLLCKISKFPEHGIWHDDGKTIGNNWKLERIRIPHIHGLDKNYKMFC